MFWKGSKKTRMVAAAVLMLALLAGCGQNGEQKVEKSSSQKASSGPAEKTALQIGQAGRTDDLEITVTKVEKAAEWINSPAPGREYVVVSFKVVNISKEKQSIGAGDFQFVNQESGSREAHERTTGVKANPDTFGAANIAPGDTFEGSLVYAMPAAMRHVELHYIEGYSREPELRFVFDK